MNKITKLFSLTVLIAFLANNSVAQDLKYCSTDEMVKKSLEANPQFVHDFLAEQTRLDQIDQAEFKTGYKSQGKGMEMAIVYTIPVVFHILHLGGTENISNAQVFDAMRVINEDFSKTNADNAATVSTFTSTSANSDIIFKLAQKNPSGICTNGIDRIYSAETNVGDDGSKLNDWPRNKYLNIWVVNSIASGAAGYSYLPGTTSAATDGILILHSYVGSIGTGTVQRSHALGHEIGHFLNLKHCWGSTNNPGVDCSGTDNVSDTPPTEGWSTCNLSGATCGSTLDNVQNFMEYSYCSTMFTAGQVTRMRTALTSATGQRSSLITSTNLSATGVSLSAVLCQADFQSNLTNNIICAGSSLIFTDLSWNGTPTGWSWTFAGGTPSTSGSSNPTIVYNTPGVYNVSLTVSNTSGSVSATKTSYVIVNPSSAMYTAPMYAESFEGSAIPNADWQVKNLNTGSNTWAQTNTAAATGSNSVRIVNASTYDGYVDELVGPSIDMTAITGPSPVMTFKVAHAQQTSTSNDKLQVYVSTNCGQNWVLRKSLQGATLSTAGVQSTPFTPNSSQWVTQSVNLSGYATQPNLYYMFRFTSNAGNNIYLDDINMLGNVGVDELSSTINFNVFPNPAEDNAVISFELTRKENVELSVYDIVGRKVSSIFNGNLSAGEYTYPATKNSELSAGVYFVKLTSGNHTYTKKLIVK